MSRELQELMHGAVRDVAEPDPARLAHVARRRGLAIRRRRQALGLVGVAAAGAIVLGGVQVVREAAPAPDAGAAAVPQVESEPGEVRATGRTTAAALVESVLMVTDGEVSDIAGQGGGVVEGGAEHETFARLTLDPADRSGLSEIGVNVQPKEPLTTGYSCGGGELIACRAEFRDDGSTLVTYEIREGRKVLSVASLVRADGVRIGVSSSNGLEGPRNTWQQTRERPSLTVDQLREIVERPVWGLQMPASYVASGERLEFDDVDVNDPDDWIEAPSGR